MPQRFIRLCFEQGIEGLRRQHMDLIDDIDFVFADQWGIGYLFDDLTDVVDTVVAGGIEFDDVRMVSFQVGFAVGALITGFAVEV